MNNGKDDPIMKEFNALRAPFKIYGVPLFEKNGLMERVPRALREELPLLEFLGRRTPGARLAFRTDSEHFDVKIHFEKISADIGMSIFACQSANVYAGSRYLGLARAADYNTPIAAGSFTKQPGMQDIMIYLPRNEVVTGITIAVDDNAVIEAPTPYKRPVPIVFYGSSITEGGCCSKPANAYNALVCRWLDSDFINLGFSGSARGELAMADYINTLDMSLFVLDYDHNAPSVEHLAATHEPFFKRIREKHPDLPILILTRPDADYGDAEARRDVVRATYDNAVKAGDKNVWFIDGKTYYGEEDRDACSADTCHPNDLGMYRMAQVIKPVLEEMFRRIEE